MSDASKFGLRRNPWVVVLGWVAGVALLLAFPFFVNQEPYILHVGIVVFLNICLATSMWLIWSLGFVSFSSPWRSACR